jgi:hypothetical protein
MVEQAAAVTGKFAMSCKSYIGISDALIPQEWEKGHRATGSIEITRSIKIFSDGTAMFPTAQ